MNTLRDEATMNSVRERIGKLTADSKPLWGKMNVGQMLCHCNDGCQMSMGKLEVGDTSNILSRTLFKFLVLNVIKMPKDAPTAAELDQMKDGTPPEDFERDREMLLASLAEVSSMPIDSGPVRHPFFGNMTRTQWSRLGYKHIDHHLRQFGV